MQELRHVLWIGGASRAGKTTIARRLARRHGLRWYSADAQTWRHRDRAVAAGHAAAVRFESLSLEERTTKRPAEMWAMGLHDERGPMVVDDLRALPVEPLVVAEGSVLPAFAVSSGIAAAGRAVWLLPTFAFGQSHVDGRAMPPHIRAWHAETYRLGLEHIEREAAEHGAPVIVVDGTQDLDEVAADVESRFRDALDEGPRAETTEARRGLLREENDQVLGQCRGYLSRPWASADEETFVRDFVCECDDPLCEEQLELTVADAARRLAESKPVIAHAAASVSGR